MVEVFENPNNLIIAGVLAGVLIAASIVNTGSKHSGRQGFPCYCSPCENNLIEAATNGDVVAQKKLALAIEKGKYTGGFQLGPIALIVGVVILVLIVSNIGKLGQQYGQPVTGFMETKLRGR
jgi:hypothetical protein